MKKYLIATGLAALLTACNSNIATTTPSSAATANSWSQLGSWLNVVEDATAVTSRGAIAITASGVPYATWYEEEPVDSIRSVYVKTWNGTKWVQVGGALNINPINPAVTPSIAVSGEYPVVSWSEFDGTSYNVYVKRWNGTKWIRLRGALDTTLNAAASEPHLVSSNGTPTVTWTEQNSLVSNIYFKYWNGSNWVQLGGSISNGYGWNPSTAVSGASLVVSWTEQVGNTKMVYAKKWNNTNSSWVQLGGALNINTSKAAYQSTITVDASGNPIVAWVEDDTTHSNIYVKRWNGTAWVQMAGYLDVNSNQNSFNPAITFDSGNPTVTWDEATNGRYRVYVKTWNGTSWAQQGGPVDSTALWHAQKPSIAKVGSNMYVTWYQDGMDVMVARFN